MNDEPAHSPWRSVIALTLVFALLGGVWFVMRELRRSAALQDCFASGRTNCVRIDSTGGK
jgi:hypothetical protein